MGGKAYIEAVFVLPPVIVGCLCQFVYSFYINAEFYLKKQTRIAIATMISAALNLGLNYLLIPRFGYIAAAYTTLFGYLFLLVFHSISLYGLGKRHWYDNRFNYMVVAVFLIMVPVTNALYAHSIIRYIVIAVLFMITVFLAFRYRAVIIAFLRQNLGLGKKKYCAADRND